jgi:methionine-rich copper-binding protein CopC
MTLRRLVTALLLAGVALVVSPAPAAAHAELIASTPAENAALAAPPAQVQLTFNEPVTPAENAVTVAGPDGATWTVGTPSAAGAVVTVPVQPTGPAGPYTLTYRVLSGDGDLVDGTVRFTLTTAATTTTTTTTTTSAPAPTSTTPSTVEPVAAAADDGGVPIWVWVVGALVVALAGLLVARLATRRSRG